MENNMDTLFIVTQMVMTVAVCLNLFFTITVWYNTRNKKQQKTIVVVEKKDVAEKKKPSRKTVSRRN